MAVEQLLRRHSRSRDEHMPLSNNWPGSHPIDGGWIRHLLDLESATKPLPPFWICSPAGAEREDRSEVQISNAQFENLGSLASGKHRDGLRVYFTVKLCRVLRSGQTSPFIRGKQPTIFGSNEKVQQWCGCYWGLCWGWVRGGNGDAQSTLGGWEMSLPGGQGTRPSFLQVSREGLDLSLCLLPIFVLVSGQSVSK